jgi:hypothetical protein
MRLILLLGVLLSFPGEVFSQEIEEVIVTGSRIGAWDDLPYEGVPAIVLRKRGDFMLQRVRIMNDSRDAGVRTVDMRRTLASILAKAEADKLIELSIEIEGFVESLNKENLGNISITEVGNKEDTSHGFFLIKTRVPDANQEVSKRIEYIHTFRRSIETTGRTRLLPAGGIELSIIGPDRYRSDIVKKIAADVRAVTGALGKDYRVVLEGMHYPVIWDRASLFEMVLYIPYSYTVLPTSEGSSGR